jgi:hypothetical protein
MAMKRTLGFAAKSEAVKTARKKIERNIGRGVG